jgi:glycosyltransferase involved in cell wall biosynthesis
LTRHTDEIIDPVLPRESRAMTIGIKYIAHGDASGYGLAALGYVRALHHAGVALWWQPWHLGANPAPIDTTSWRAAEGDASLADIAELARATGRPVEYDTVVAHTPPEDWPRFVEAGKRFVGYTVWEVDALPAHWPALLNRADLILVPSQLNREIFLRCGVTRPVRVVPHVRRHAWSGAAQEDAPALRRQMRIPEEHFVFYSICSWDPRKALGELIELFVREFASTEPVTLLLKTSSLVTTWALGAQSSMGVKLSVKQLAARIAEDASRAVGRAAANVRCIAAEGLSGRVIDAIHAAGDAYVSLAHGEGWGMGAFDAATLGKPVLITGWGGQLDYLGADYPGLLRYEMVPVRGWLPHASPTLPHASLAPAQRWAMADSRHAAQLMRAAMARERSLLHAATAVREKIAIRFAEPVVARQFIEALAASPS